MGAHGGRTLPEWPSRQHLWRVERGAAQSGGAGGVAGRGLLGGGSRKKKAFFFEKKKQETFANCVRHGGQAGITSAARNE
jgi:hypothetical protein